MNADEFKRLRELDKWLGSKKWYRGESTDEDGNVFADDMILCESYCVGEPTEICCVHVDGEYADLICEMRNALPGLLDRVEELGTIQTNLEAELDRMIRARKKDADDYAALKAENARLRESSDDQEKMLCRKICFMVQAAGIDVDDSEDLGSDDAIESVRRKFSDQTAEIRRLREKGDRLASELRGYADYEPIIQDEVDALREWEAARGEK